MRRANSITILTVVFLIIARPASAWGLRGHMIAAYIAQMALTPAASEMVTDLLGDETLSTVSVLPDQWRVARPETRTWHWVDIPIEAEGYDHDRDCPSDNCLVPRIERFTRVLADPERPKEERREALIWIVHLIADAHQPLHCANAGDQAGNLTKVVHRGRLTNLHAVWDSQLLPGDGKDDRKYAMALFDRMRERPVPAGSVSSWVNESQKIAFAIPYEFESSNLGEEYDMAVLPIVEQQLVRAGLRIAATINAAVAPRAGS